MVVFTCNNCGESLQKPKVEKHFSFSCRGEKDLTCVDCFKDFKGDEYTVHVKCVTENQRYGSKDYVEKAKKGEAKQESWMEMIKSILMHEPDITAGCRNLLNSICNFSNVPRKKQKFVNFIKSSAGGRVSVADVEGVWNLIEKHKRENANEGESQDIKANDAGDGKRKVDDGDAKKTKGKGLTDEGHDEDQPKKKKKKNKHKENGVVSTEDGDKEMLQDAEGDKSKKKKKTKYDENDEIINNDGEKQDQDKGQPNKKKKKNKQNENGVVNMLQNTEEPVATEAMDKTTKKKKIRRDENDQSSNIINGESAGIEKEEPRNRTLGDSNASISEESFSLVDEIENIVTKKGSMSLGKLEKKVLKKYKTMHGEEVNLDKFSKKFNKKLKKIQGILVDKDSVQLKRD